MPGEKDFGPKYGAEATFDGTQGQVVPAEDRDADGNTLYKFVNTDSNTQQPLGTLTKLKELMAAGTLTIPSYVPGVEAAGRRRRKSLRRKSHRRKSRRSRK
jgi:hypothetical protein